VWSSAGAVSCISELHLLFAEEVEARVAWPRDQANPSRGGGTTSSAVADDEEPNDEEEPGDEEEGSDDDSSAKSEYSVS